MNPDQMCLSLCQVYSGAGLGRLFLSVGFCPIMPYQKYPDIESGLEFEGGVRTGLNVILWHISAVGEKISCDDVI